MPLEDGVYTCGELPAMCWELLFPSQYYFRSGELIVFIDKGNLPYGVHTTGDGCDF